MDVEERVLSVCESFGCASSRAELYRHAVSMTAAAAQPSSTSAQSSQPNEDADDHKTCRDRCEKTNDVVPFGARELPVRSRENATIIEAMRIGVGLF